ncbi:unnamed protein product [Staurois parvus]|uniref:Uncharacterized protein n=1 Tax=Staurois parvus TaxID=386267 RepID=A0ABN9HP28_9NEOB|nr:unnamed protein product [Staurois parvus]
MCIRVKGRSQYTACAGAGLRGGVSRYTCARLEGRSRYTCARQRGGARLKGRGQYTCARLRGRKPVHPVQD